MTSTEGAGQYAYIAVGGRAVACQNWHDIPDQIENLLWFMPELPPDPHTQADHNYIDTFNPKFQEILGRCQK